MGFHSCGESYRIAVEDGVVEARVVASPRLSLEEGARETARLSDTLIELAPLATRGLFLDVRAAPPVAGPRSQRSILSFLAAWEAAGKPVAVLVGDAAVQRLQMRRLVEQSGAKAAQVSTNRRDAKAWLDAPARPGIEAAADSSRPHHP